MSSQQNNQDPADTGKPGIPDLEPPPVAGDESSQPPVPKPEVAPAGTARPAGRGRRRRAESSATRTIERWLNGLLLLSALAFGLAWHQQDRLPPPQALLPDLAQAPLQTPMEEPPFQFSYRKHDYEVKTFAAYELWGVIVSHNDISGLSDIYHTADSLDTKDICVLWGDNATRDDYLKTVFTSGAWTCNYEYPQGVTLNTNEVSNNHLITDSDSLRRTIDGLRRGDQVHVRGRLVGYHDLKSPDNWRNSSLIRTDSGNGACEVVFVEQLDVLKPANPGWRKLYRIAGVAGLVLLLIRSLFLLAELLKPADERLGRFTSKK